MSRIAVFVDAGYLFAQGSTALTGSKKRRTDIEIDEKKLFSELIALADERSNGASLLRIYWYDGALGYGGPTLEQERIAGSANVKLRLGFINRQGQQKGVDSLIVTDLINLARNSAISDALLMSGDEDVRIGVEIAQGFGVRTHLLGIVPSRGSQSRQLLFEADTTAEWSQERVSKFMTVIPVPESSTDEIQETREQATDDASRDDLARLADLVDQFVNGLHPDEMSRLKEHWMRTRDIPPEYDRKLLATGGTTIGRNLADEEKRFYRKLFREKTGCP